MKVFKKILLAIFILFSLSLLIGYVYFDKKFSPEKNYLSVKSESGKIKIKWHNKNKDAILIPIHFENDSTTYYLQLDTGSPYTLFYKNSIKSISQINLKNNLGKSSFRIGKTIIESNKFKIIDYGEKLKKDQTNIIGTLGTDILEERKTVLNFKENNIEFNLTEIPQFVKGKTFDFEFKKRKIIIPAILNGEKQQFLYDSGTSSYELLTQKENWYSLKLPHSKILVEKGNSWGNILTTYSAKTRQEIEFENIKIPLTEVTYVDGFSKTQYYLMKFSGMSGMLGNQIFLKRTIYIDAKEMKMSIE